jgi:DNA-binding HxlR family transcriptional regulator
MLFAAAPLSNTWQPMPKIDRPTRGSKTGRPIMVLLDLLGRRMALRVIWELHLAGHPLTFREIQAAAGTNPGVLNARVKELRDAQIVERATTGYGLTPLGRSLVAVFLPITEWSEHWGAKLRARKVRE